MKLLVLLAVIGVAVADTLPYIIGGEDVTKAGKFPWQGSIRVNGRHNCGICLISANWAVTAAHCVDGQSIGSMTFMFGSNKRTADPNEDAGTVEVGATEVIMHEDYGIGSGSFPNDIAVVKFSAPVSSDFAGAVPMAPSGSEHADNDNCIITGWGYIKGGSTPDILQEATVPVHTNTECKDHWSSSINAGHVCIGEQGKGSCNGDSGGPLVCMVNGRYELVGATSWGLFGCSTSKYTVYTRIAYFRDWINGKTGI